MKRKAQSLEQVYNVDGAVELFKADFSANNRRANALHQDSTHVV